ncbi:hypothetical protein [Acinetobacter sp. WCHAc010052]|uniref:hypothetical protein n=1 Tax=Acinetobacter sp. WCHAc010052 TaxID=2004647 RepID=UPI000B3CF56B|nr:hypothetical protein [Acinetobacter sp. WCHAc010052]AXY60179.1 carboxypeptidase regulatory-like domain-containing protein [Acinetobacter sp. WCHAc010052]
MQLKVLSNNRSFLPPKTAVQSFKVKGVIKTNYVNTAGVLVRLFARSDATLVGQAITDLNGSYQLTVRDKEDKFLVAHHPKRLFNAVIQDNVVPK